jgi:hypothetical protein
VKKLTFVAPAGNIVNFAFSTKGVLKDVFEGRRQANTDLKDGIKEVLKWMEQERVVLYYVVDVDSGEVVSYPPANFADQLRRWGILEVTDEPSRILGV